MLAERYYKLIPCKNPIYPSGCSTQCKIGYCFRYEDNIPIRVYYCFFHASVISVSPQRMFVEFADGEIYERTNNDTWGLVVKPPQPPQQNKRKITL